MKILNAVCSFFLAVVVELAITAEALRETANSLHPYLFVSPYFSASREAVTLAAGFLKLSGLPDSFLLEGVLWQL